jgi:hypothetical protein
MIKARILTKKFVGCRKLTAAEYQCPCDVLGEF